MQNWPLFNKLKEIQLLENHPSSDFLLESFLKYSEELGLTLYPAQEEAILELYSDKNLILNTPTGSGKSLVATALHFHSLGSSKRSVYTCPIKALVNEKFLALCKDFGPDQVGMITGDGSVNPKAPILCCTAEILANMALREGANTGIDDVIMDEFHYYSDRDRGVAWQIPLLTMSKTRFLLMSATLGDTDFFEKSLFELNQKPVAVIKSMKRPVPLDFHYSEHTLIETINEQVLAGRSPIYLVNFSQRECAEQAQNLSSLDFCTKEEKKAISQALESTKFSSPYGKEFGRLLRHGIGLHHAGLLPKYRILVEQLAQKGLLKIISGTDTLGVGVNIPIRTVLFTKLCKFDGQKTTILTVRDFKQISGRAGRKGFDDLGTVIAQAPEHIIENLRNEQKAMGDPKKLKKLVKKKPPDKGYVPWNKDTLFKLANGTPEALISRFQVSHGMLLNVLSRKNENGCQAMKNLINIGHEKPEAKKMHKRKAFALFRSLVERKIIELKPLRINISLQEDFSLNHALSLYLLDTIKLLNKEDPDYALDILTLAESIIENPDTVLKKQLDRVKNEKMAEMKLEGIEYEERIAKLEELEYPKPKREFIYTTFNEFAASHPWVEQENIRPKSVAREMYENFHTFSEYIREYDLQRVEGQLLRYLTEVYKVLSQTIPEDVKSNALNDDLRAIEDFFGTMIRAIDSSLLDEWEKLKNPLYISKSELKETEEAPLDVTKNERQFKISIQNSVFRFLRSLAKEDYEGALELIVPNEWNQESLENAMSKYYEEHEGIELGPKARSNQFFHLVKSPLEWTIQQILVDPEEGHDWALNFTVNLAQSKVAKAPVLQFLSLSPL